MVGDDTRRGVKRKRKKRPPFGGGRKSGRVSHDDRPPRGVWLSEDVQNYFSRVLEVERQGFDSHEDRVCFARNVFEEMVGKEVEYSCSGLVSRVTEALVPASDDATLARTCDAFAQQLPLACTDPCASHVAQALLLESADRVRRGAEGSEALAEFVLSVGRFLVADLDRFVWHRYANHIARSCLAALTGVECGTNGRQKPQGGQRNKEVTPAADATRTGVPMSEEAAALAKEFAAWTLASPQLPDMCSVDLASGYLQCLLPAIRSVDKALAQKLVKRLLDDCFAAGEEDREGGAEAPRLPKVFDSMPSKRLLETTIEVASSKRYKQLYGRLFEGRLATLSLDRNANFAVQKLLRRCREKDDFESMYAEISPKFMDIITVGNTGVVLAVGETCERLAAKQNDFIVSLAKAFDCWEPEPRQNHFAVCVLRMKPYGEVTKSAAVESGDNVEDNNRTKPSVNIHGSLIVQAMLRFKKPIKVINSLLSTDANELCDILCDPKGSHVVDNYTTSEYVGEKSRERLVNKLKGHYVRLACDRHGSRSFDSVWRRAGAGHRARIAAELSAREAAVTASEYGRIIASKVALNEFRHKREVWTRMVAEGGRSGPEKTKDMFKDIVAGLEIKAEV